MSRKKILILGSFAESLVNFRGPLVFALSRKLEVHVAAPQIKSNTKIESVLKKYNVKVHEIPINRTGINPFCDAKCFLAIFRLMFSVRPEIFLGYTIKPIIYGCLAACLCKVVHQFALITGLGYTFSEQGQGQQRVLSAFVQILYKLSLINVSKVFFQNPDDQELFRRLGLLRSTTPSVVVNGSGVDLSRFAVVALPLRTAHFLFMARLLCAKGVHEYAIAAERIKALYPDVRFSLAGWIDKSPDSIKQSELDHWVYSGLLEYHGRLDDVRPAITACNVYVFPSYYREGIPRSVLEAMAMGRAIITTNAPGCRETVVDGLNGFLVPVRSVEALTHAMKRFIENPTLAVRMGANSRKIAEDKFDVNKVNSVILSEMGL